MSNFAIEMRLNFGDTEPDEMRLRIVSNVIPNKHEAELSLSSPSFTPHLILPAFNELHMATQDGKSVRAHLGKTEVKQHFSHRDSCESVAAKAWYKPRPSMAE